MAFWGIEVKSGKPFTHRFDNQRGRLHISQATLSFGSSTQRSVVQCIVGDKSPIPLCALLPDKNESCPLDLEFEEEDAVIFSVLGPRSVHWLLHCDLVAEDMNMMMTRPILATLGVGCSTERTDVQCVVGDKNPILLCAFLPTKNLSCPLDIEFEEEDDVIFSVCGPRSVYLTGFYLGNGPREDVITENKKVEVGADRDPGIKRKFDTTIHDTSAKKNFVDTDHVDNEDRRVVFIKKKKDRREVKKKSESQETDENANTGDEEKKVSTVETEDNEAEVIPLQVRTFSNGLVIEDLEYGKPDAEIASAGSKVSVHYIGKLKTNGNVFDSTYGGAPYRFRLGAGQVIKGWDVGINGMRVGEKRRLTIPPSMGYGSRGALSGKVPGESWLVMDIELVGVR